MTQERDILTMRDEASDTVVVSREDIQEAIDLLGGFMGSVDGFRKAEALRDRLRAALIAWTT
jgi:hypothetical protein